MKPRTLFILLGMAIYLTRDKRPKHNTTQAPAPTPRKMTEAPKPQAYTVPFFGGLI